LMAYEGNLIWARFNAFLVAHSIILAIVTLNAGSKDPEVTLTFGLPLAGLVFSAVWTVITKRGSDYYTYWILSMRELEETHLAPEVRTVSRGADFAAGRPVGLTLGGRPHEHRMSPMSRRVPIIASSYTLIAVFAVIYLLLFVSAFT
jgi:hypothetical protein